MLFSSVIFPRRVLSLFFVCFSNCGYFISNWCFLPLVNKFQTGLFDQTTSMAFHQSYMTQ